MLLLLLTQGYASLALGYYLLPIVGRNLPMLKLLTKNPRSGFWIVAQGKRSAALGNGQINNCTLEEGAGNKSWNNVYSTTSINSASVNS